MRFPSLHVHWHRAVSISLLDQYGQCRCGHRTWKPIAKRGYWPVDHDWLRGVGDLPWDRPMTPPSRAPSGYQAGER